MCTAITYKTKDHYFGRNLDLEYSYKETVTVTPRNYVFDFRKMGFVKQKTNRKENGNERRMFDLRRAAEIFRK